MRITIKQLRDCFVRPLQQQPFAKGCYRVNHKLSVRRQAMPFHTHQIVYSILKKNSLTLGISRDKRKSELET